MTDTPNPVPVKELRELLEKATKAPWEAYLTDEWPGMGPPFRAGAAVAEFEDGRKGVVARFHHDTGPGFTPDTYALAVYIGISVEQAYHNRNLIVALVNHANSLLCAEERAQRAELRLIACEAEWATREAVLRERSGEPMGLSQEETFEWLRLRSARLDVVEQELSSLKERAEKAEASLAAQVEKADELKAALFKAQYEGNFEGEERQRAKRLESAGDRLRRWVALEMPRFIGSMTHFEAKQALSEWREALSSPGKEDR